MTIVINKFEIWSFSQSFNSAPPAPHVKVDQELHHMKNPPYSILW